MAHARADPPPVSPPLAGPVQPLVLGTPSRHHQPCAHGAFPLCSFLLSAVLQFEAVSGDPGFLPTCSALSPLSPPSSSLQIASQRVLKHQPEWSIHPGSSVSQPRAQIFAHAAALRPAPPVALGITPSSLTASCSAHLPLRRRPSLSSSPCACRPLLKFLPVLVLSLQAFLPRLVLVI